MILIFFIFIEKYLYASHKSITLSTVKYNRQFLGDVSAWMYNCLAGINYDADQPGFAHVVIRPYFVKDLQWVKGSYKSVKGLIRSEWKREDGNIKLTVEIPSGTTATVYADKEYRIGSGIHSFVIKKN